MVQNLAVGMWLGAKALHHGIWPCLFCIRRLQFDYGVHHGNFFAKLFNLGGGVRDAAAGGPPLWRRRPHKSQFFFEILNYWLRKF